MCATCEEDEGESERQEQWRLHAIFVMHDIIVTCDMPYDLYSKMIYVCICRGMAMQPFMITKIITPLTDYKFSSNYQGFGYDDQGSSLSVDVPLYICIGC